MTPVATGLGGRSSAMKQVLAIRLRNLSGELLVKRFAGFF